MVESWIITITTINQKGNTEEISFVEYGDIFACTRLVNSFRPKRGHKKLKFEIERGATLV